MITRRIPSAAVEVRGGAQERGSLRSPLHFWIVASIIRRSMVFSGVPTGKLSRAGAEDPLAISAGKSPASIASVLHSTTARSMVFSSCRTFPGQWWASKHAMARGVRPDTARLWRTAKRSTKWRASKGMSSRCGIRS